MLGPIAASRSSGLAPNSRTSASNCGGCHSGSRAAPSGMNGGNGSALGVGKEQWDAVGGTNSDRHARIIGHEGIAGTAARVHVANRI